MAEAPAPTGRDLNSEAMRAMAAGDFASARGILELAVETITDNPALWLNLAAARRAQADVEGALAAVEGALKIEPRSFMALLMKGSLTERKGERRRAAMLYGAAAALAPPVERLDPATARALKHAQETHAAYLQELSSFIDSSIGSVRERGSSAEARRINAFVDLSLGRKLKFRQEPSEFFYPGLPSIEFWERDPFPWLAEFESATAAIRGELLQILRDDFRDFVPYLDYAEGLPLDQWQSLNRSKRWGALHLLHYGKRVEDNCRRCPQTLEAVSRLPQPSLPQRSPAAMFSALQPKTRIPAHTGVANVRLVVHLPLIVPDGCGFRVGSETRPWKEGQAWVFDDTMEHEAWNESTHPRVIFICDIWNPLLSLTERDSISAVMAAIDKFNGTVPKDSL